MIKSICESKNYKTCQKFDRFFLEIKFKMDRMNSFCTDVSSEDRKIVLTSRGEILLTFSLRLYVKDKVKYETGHIYTKMVREHVDECWKCKSFIESNKL